MSVHTMKDGVYTASAQGFCGPVPVRVTILNGRIEDVEVLPNAETEPFILYPILKYPPLIREYQTLDIDTISGATFCSRAILEAVSDCVKQAGGDPDAMRRVPGPVKHPETVVERSCDVVVLGTGGSGCSAAAMAAERGAKVIVLEKGIFIGGITCGANCMLAIDSRIQKEAGIELDVKAIFDEMMSWNHYFGNSRLIRRYLRETGPLVDWLQDKGIDMVYSGHEQVTNPFDCTVHFAAYGDTRAMADHRANMQILLDCALDRGGEIFYETRARCLLKAADGTITGVRAVRDDGSALIVHAKAVILATGGYSANREMAEKYFTYRDRFCMPGWMAEGDGLAMAIEAGAKTKDLGARVIHLAVPELAKYAQLTVNGNFVPAALSTFPSILYVNNRGKRFMNEYLVHNSLAVGNMLTAQGNYGDALTIFSEEILTMLIEGDAAAMNLDVTPGGFWGGDYTTPGYFKTIKTDMQPYLDCHVIVKADTLEELAGKLGIDPKVFVSEVNRYNAHCRAGQDTDFFKDAKYLFEIRGGPYYAMHVMPWGMGSIGGIMIDEHMHVLDRDCRQIPGLFAAGSCAGGIWGQESYGIIEGETCSWAFTSGYMAGKDASAYALGLSQEEDVL